MSRALVVFLAPGILCLALASCGGSNSSTHITGQAPVFTSAPVTAAAQSEAYTYQLAATDPAGGTVSFALTTSPTGAALSSITVNWTPTASQSRSPNNFTVTATTSEGATATQSWMVSPTGIITVNDVYTYWEPTGPVQVPAPSFSSLQISAIVPNSDGSLTVLPGAAASPGVISIAGVPAGNYWLTFGATAIIPGVSPAYWTSASTIDAGRDVSGNPVAFTASNSQTNFAFNLSGLASLSGFTNVLFNPENQSVSFFVVDQPNSNTLSETTGVSSDFDWSQVAAGFLIQQEPQTLGHIGILPLLLNVAGPAATISNPSFVNGSTNPITATLEAAPVSYDVNVQGSQWVSSFTGAGPSTATPYASAFSITAAPFMTGASPQIPLGSSMLTFAQTAPQLGIFPIDSLCDLPGFSQSSLQPAITADVDLGNVTYDDGFPSTWTRAETYCTEATMPVATPGSAMAKFSLTSSETVVPSSTSLTPIVGPVQSPTINSASLYTAATLTTTTPALSWSAPASGTPYGYHVTAFAYDSNAGDQYVAAGSFYTSQTSVTLPPLSAGNTYVFSITALVDGAANIQTSPFRSKLPTGFASVVSAPITISGSATGPEIHGDASLIKRLSQPVEFRHAIAADKR